MLVQAILDYVVDKAMDVVDKYHEKILALERQVLIRPKMTTVRQCGCLGCCHYDTQLFILILQCIS